ncbi:MAG: transcription-repair coupling factor [Propionibacteriaceae bacterium]
MSHPSLVNILANDSRVAAALSDARRRSQVALDLTSPAALRPLLVAALSQESTRPILLVMSTYREAEALTDELSSLMGEDAVAYYPAWETLPHERLSPRSDTVGKRLAVLRRLAGTDTIAAPRIVVAPVRSVLQPQVKGLAQLRPVQLVQGQEYDIAELARDLVDAAYTRVDLVERRGEFAVRGGIVDVFPPTLEHPVRIDFFGDVIEEIASFTVADQRSTSELLTEVVATPCRELLLTSVVRQRAESLITDHPELSEMLERIAAGHAVDGMEALAPALVDGMELLVDVMPSDTLVMVADPELVRSRAIDLVATSKEFLRASWAAAAAGGKAPIDLGSAAYRSLADVRAHALERGMGWWTLSPFNSGTVEEQPDEDLGAGVDSYTIVAEPAPTWRGDVAAAVAQIRQFLADNWRVVLSVEGHGLGKRLAEVLREHDVSVTIEESLLAEPAAGVVTIVTAQLRHGVLVPDIKLALLTAGDLAGAQAADKADRRMPTRRKKQIDPLELTPGDPVVHESHGVGRYIEMVQRTVANATRDYLVVQYASSKRGQPGDMLYVPMDQLDLVTRYVGGEAPTLDKLGGSDWNKRKTRAKKAVKEIAAELIKLYAARQASKGHAFSPDTVWQRELEDAFSYVETPDQLACIDEVKQDMEQIVPMDRLICGDVGYGKTEIAVRAAFKAVQDGKQVAVLVPTTLLVQQHWNTFAERYSGFPVTVAKMSRFQSDAEITKVKDGIRSGAVDVAIGTHRLLSKEIGFKDLGLVIIDEEQRFGVEHKEALKQLRLNVDVLAMSATPIPRTLEMAITGIREMSVIATPPEERHPVLTFAGPYDDGQVTAAIRRELAREGQVFYVHNRVQSIEKAAARIRELVPEARVVTAHGQMNERQLEQVMVDFWERRADVLVATTIVEAGLDISTANTLLIERADLLGLSQLHQLRGRVGRSRERAYAYFLYPPEKSLTQTAHDRLATMSAHTDLGAGMAIAMKDLEIRGAGNLLGGEQSGHIADVGFDLYIRLVGEAVTQFRDGPEVAVEAEMKVELPVDALLPATYVESERLRLEMYKRLAQVRSEADIEAVRAELADRYGTLPPQAESLLDVARLRVFAREHGVTDIVTQGKFIRFAPAELPESRQLRAQRLYPGVVIKPELILIPAPTTARIGGTTLRDQEMLDWAHQVIEALFPVVVTEG